MKNGMKISLAIGLAAVFFLAISPTLAVAQKLPPASVAVIDTQKILQDAAAFKTARKQLDEQRTKYQAEFGKEEEKLRVEEQEVNRQRAVLSPDAYEAKRRDFEKKVVDVQRRVQDRSRQLEQTFGGARNDVGKTMRKIVSDLAGERGFNVVLEVAQLNYSAPDLDITAEVLKRLDQQMPTVKLALPPG